MSNCSKQPEQIEPDSQNSTEKAPTTSQTLTYGTPKKRTEYTVSTQHNGYEMEGHVLRRIYFDNQVGSIGQSFYTDGQWHTTANIPQGIKIMQFPDAAMALQVARDDAHKNHLGNCLANSKITDFTLKNNIKSNNYFGSPGRMKL